jgi:phosphopantothenoylcysteine decarboxylase/phosphopantothenate--cysteine ligase
MGFALAEAARDRGAKVTVVAGPTSVDPPAGVTVVPVVTAAEMERAMSGVAASADIVLMAAAVADYRPARPSAQKIKRGSGAMSVALEPNPDILAGLAMRRRPGQVFVGFALETSRGLANARAKLAAKGLDLVVLNSPREGIGGETNRVTLVEAPRAGRAAKPAALPLMAKREVAERVLERALSLHAARRPKKARRARQTVKRAARKAR